MHVAPSTDVHSCDSVYQFQRLTDGSTLCKALAIVHEQDWDLPKCALGFQLIAVPCLPVLCRKPLVLRGAKHITQLLVCITCVRSLGIDP
jgi:hypothetical protein